MRKLLLLAVLVAFGLSFTGCEADPDATYKVLYYDNGSTSGFSPIDPNQYKSGMEAIVLGKGTLEKRGAEFKNWNTNRDGSGDSYEVGEKITITDRNVFLYAIWIEPVRSSYKESL